MFAEKGQKEQKSGSVGSGCAHLSSHYNHTRKACLAIFGPHTDHHPSLYGQESYSSSGQRAMLLGTACEAPIGSGVNEGHSPTVHMPREIKMASYSKEGQTSA